MVQPEILLIVDVKYNMLEIYKGDNKSIVVNFTDANGDAIDITDYTVFFTVKENEDDSDDDAKIKKDITSHSDPTNGETTISLTPSDTEDLECDKYYYDIQTKDGDGNITTVTKDDFNIKQDITRRES